MNSFTNYEKTVIVSLLKLVMEADTIIHPLEEMYMNTVLDELDLSASFFEHYSCVDVQTCKLCINEMDALKKSYINSLLVGMAEADGFIDPREQQLLDKL